MGDKRRENPAYAEDVDIMIVEYLIHSTTKACIDDFLSKNGRDPIVQPSQSVLTQIHILNGKAAAMDSKRVALTSLQIFW